MAVTGRVKKGEYFDSVSLMVVGKKVAALDGVVDAAVVMGTQENRAILEASGLMLSEFRGADDTDLLIAVKAGSSRRAAAVQREIDALLDELKKKPAAAGGEVRARGLNAALDVLPGANLALISVAGRYAGEEARKALEAGLHVMLFSDNVPLETEIELKRLAAKRGLLVMGPDCGTAIINGLPLAFANAVERGDIGVVGASGTGTQEVTCVISNSGAGVSQVIGTGGRDVKTAVGGIMFLSALKALAEDDATRVILLVSKPPDKAVLARIGREVRRITKPVVAVFLGADPKELARLGIPAEANLEDAALRAAAVSTGRAERVLSPEQRDARERELVEKAAAKRRKGGRFLRGLFSGGTFCAEAQVVLAGKLAPLYSNVPAGKTRRLADHLKSRAHTVVDMGSDEFTAGRPHPMIDYTLRNRRILEEAQDSGTAAILLDVVLGYGSNPDPAADLAPVIRKASGSVAVVCSVTGTDRDPQGRAGVIKALRAAGAIVLPTNAAACRVAGAIVGRTGARGKTAA